MSVCPHPLLQKVPDYLYYNYLNQFPWQIPSLQKKCTFYLICREVYKLQRSLYLLLIWLESICAYREFYWQEQLPSPPNYTDAIRDCHFQYDWAGIPIAMVPVWEVKQSEMVDDKCETRDGRVTSTFALRIHMHWYVYVTTSIFDHFQIVKVTFIIEMYITSKLISITKD